jgi:hypothetical protein
LKAATSHLEITLKYDGRDVDDGTMPIDDVISALRGFSNAYGRIASASDPNGQHQIRVSAINRSSFAVTILAWASEHLTTIATAATPIAALIVTTIIKLIELKKATKGQPPAAIKIDGDNNTIIVTTAGDNTQIAVPRDVYDLYKSKALDGELGKIVAPLTEGKIEAVSLAAKTDALMLEPVVITNSEKAFFHAAEEVTTTTSKPVSLDGHMISLNKETNRGMFKMQNGAKVRYHLIGDNPAQMYSDFAYKGPVRVDCIASFDNNLELKGIDVSGITRLQLSLFSDPGTDVDLTLEL